MAMVDVRPMSMHMRQRLVVMGMFVTAIRQVILVEVPMMLVMVVAVPVRNRPMGVDVAVPFDAEQENADQHQNHGDPKRWRLRFF